MRSGARTDLAPNDAKSELSDAQAAKVMKVSERSVERAKHRRRTDPEAHAKAKSGTLRRKVKPKPIDGARDPKPKVSKPDLAEMVARLNTLWSAGDVDHYRPVEQRLSMLKTHAPNVMRKLAELALRFNYPLYSSGLSLKQQRAIDAILDERGGEAAGAAHIVAIAANGGGS